MERARPRAIEFAWLLSHTSSRLSLTTANHAACHPADPLKLC
jgi:hypothetical protein